MSKSETARIEAFSDGIIGIAATLLILEVKVPPLHSMHSLEDLRAALLHLWPSYFAFVYSFGTIFVSWVNHHEAFKWIARSSRGLVYTNGLLLMTITVLPFPTALLAEYLATPYAQPAIVFFCACGALHNAGWLALMECMARTPGVVLRESMPAVAFARRATWIGAGIYAATTLLAGWLPRVALVINTSLWVLWIGTSLTAKSAD